MSIPPFSSLLAIAAHALQAPAKPGSLPIVRNGQGEKPLELLHKKGTQSGAFFMEYFSIER